MSVQRSSLKFLRGISKQIELSGSLVDTRCKVKTPQNNFPSQIDHIPQIVIRAAQCHSVPPQGVDMLSLAHQDLCRVPAFCARLRETMRGELMQFRACAQCAAD